MKCIDALTSLRRQHVAGCAVASVMLLLVSLPRPANMGPGITETYPMADTFVDDFWSAPAGHTVAIYRDVTMDEMLVELEDIRNALLATPYQEAQLLAVSIEGLEEELNRTFQEDGQQAYLQLKAGQKEAYNEVALLIADLKFLLKEMTARKGHVVISALNTV